MQLDISKLVCWQDIFHEFIIWWLKQFTKRGKIIKILANKNLESQDGPDRLQKPLSADWHYSLQSVDSQERKQKISFLDDAKIPSCRYWPFSALLCVVFIVSFECTEQSCIILKNRYLQKVWRNTDSQILNGEAQL